MQNFHLTQEVKMQYIQWGIYLHLQYVSQNEQPTIVARFFRDYLCQHIYHCKKIFLAKQLLQKDFLQRFTYGLFCRDSA